MSTRQPAADVQIFIQSALADPCTCDRSTLELVNDALGLSRAVEGPNSIYGVRSGPQSGSAVTKTVSNAKSKSNLQLSKHERTKIATYVVNTSLGVLADAVRNRAQTTKITHGQNDNSKLLSRSSDTNGTQAPTPTRSLQERSINLPSPSSKSSAKSAKAKPIPRTQEGTGLTHVAECCHAAFSYLRTSTRSNKDLQLEHGIIAFVGKLLSLKLADLAERALKALGLRLRKLHGPGDVTESPEWHKECPVDPERETLTSLLDACGPCNEVQTLVVAIGYHLCIVRAIGLSRHPALLSSLVPLLDHMKSSSPINLIIRLHDLSGDSSRAGQQLKSLSNAILSLCQGLPKLPDKRIKDDRGVISPASCLALQTSALYARLRMAQLVQCKASIDDTIFRPFARCLDVYIKQCKTGAHESYRIAVECFERLQQASSTSNEKTMSVSESPSYCKRIISASLTRFAWSAGLHAEALGWLEAEIQDARDQDTTSLMLRRAAITLDAVLLHQDIESVPKHLQHATKALERTITSDATQESMLRSVEEFHQVASTFFRTLTTREESEFRDRLDQLNDPCQQITSTSLRLFSTALQSTRSRAEGSDDVKCRDRAVRTYNAALPAVNLAITRAMRMKSLEIKYETCVAVLSDLKYCTSIVVSLHTSTTKESFEEIIGSVSVVPSLVNLSDAYLALSLALKERHVDSSRESLEEACSVLERGASSAEKYQGNLSSKLARLGRSYWSRSRWRDAASTFHRACQVLLDAGALSAIAQSSPTLGRTSLWKSTKDVSLLNDLLSDTLELVARHDLDVFGSNKMLDDDKLELPERGLLLEHQVNILSGWSHSRTLWRHALSAIPRMCLTLIDLYKEPGHHLDRGRACVKSYSLALEENDIWTSKDMNQVEQAARIVLAHIQGSKKPLTWDEQHLKASLLTYVSIRDNTMNTTSIAEALSTWHSLFEPKTQRQPATNGAVDRVSLLRLIRLLANHLHTCGHYKLQLSALRLATGLARLQEADGDMSSRNALIDLGLQLLRLGYSEQAGVYLDKARHCTNSLSNNRSMVLADAEYCLGLCDLEKCRRRLEEAAEAGSKSSQPTESRESFEERLYEACLTADYYSLSSKLSALRGEPEEATRDLKLAVARLQSVWRALEQRSSASEENSKALQKFEGHQDLITDLVNLHITDEQSKQAQQGPERKLVSSFSVWSVVTRLGDAYKQLARLSEGNGLQHEVSTSIEQIRRLTEKLNLSSLQADSLVLKGDCLSKSGQFELGHQTLVNAQEIYEKADQNLYFLEQQQSLAHVHHLQQQWTPELAIYEEARSLIVYLENTEYLQDLEGKPQTSLNNSADRCALVAATAQPQKNKAPGRKPATRTSAHPRSKPAVRKTKSIQGQGPSVSSPGVRTLSNWRMKLACFEAESRLAQKDVAGCKALLDESDQVSSPIIVQAQAAVVRSRLLLQKALGAMSADSVLGMLAESSISIPAQAYVEQQDLSKCMEELKLVENPKKSSKSAKGSAAKASKASRGAIEALQDALEVVIANESSMISLLPLATLYKAFSTGVSSAMMLSYADFHTANRLSNAACLAMWLALPSCTAARRDRSAILGEQLSRGGPSDARQSRKCGPDRDEHAEQTQIHESLCEILPESWNVVSLCLNESQEHLFITQHRGNRSPLILRLPLARQNDETEEETFSFRDATTELLSIIRGSDATVHAAQDDSEQLKVKGARSQWWATREQLDERLKDLLSNIENMWVGGFRGVFSGRPQSGDLSARFEQSFETVLDKHLPSRQKTTARDCHGKVKLDRHVLELFTSLSGIDENEMDLDEALSDLLYYVVDILQFSGEANAYDEIDFDAMTVDLHSALQSHNEAAADELAHDSNMHTILVLDKQLHLFPWESLPCLRRRSVSRVHSIIDIHERLLNMTKNPNDEIRPHGITASHSNGTYILNPGQDLPKTQSRFETPLKQLSTPTTTNWSSIIARHPTEQDFLSALYTPQPPTSNKNPTTNPNRILIYIGHGSGAQYVRHRKIKALRYGHWTPPSATIPRQDYPPMNPSTSVALLFGCSSASLTQHSEFEPSGTPKSYMASGAPALLGSLWDVTDGDIDRFAGRVLERWGLLKRGSVEAQEGGLAAAKGGKGRARVRKGKQNKGKEGNEEGDWGRMNLCEAVGRSRGDCYLEYLNGAAMVVYGVPVYVGRGDGV